jgi:hypothetical protein
VWAKRRNLALYLVVYIVTIGLKELITSKTLSKITVRDLRLVRLLWRSRSNDGEGLFIHYLQRPFIRYLQCLQSQFIHSSTVSTESVYTLSTMSTESIYTLHTMSKESVYTLSTMSTESIYTLLTMSKESVYTLSTMSTESIYTLSTMSKDSVYTLSTMSTESTYTLSTVSTESIKILSTMSTESIYILSRMSKESIYTLSTVSTESIYTLPNMSTHSTLSTLSVTEEGNISFRISAAYRLSTIQCPTLGRAFDTLLLDTLCILFSHTHSKLRSRFSQKCTEPFAWRAHYSCSGFKPNLIDVKNIKFGRKKKSFNCQPVVTRTDRQTDNGEGDVAKILAAVLPISLAKAPNRYEDAHRNRNR